MPKINYRRGETRAFVFHADSGADVRLRNQSRRTNSIWNPTARGRKGLMREHYEAAGGIQTRPTPRKRLATSRRIPRPGRSGWGPAATFQCPCCIFFEWRRDLRTNARRRRRRQYSKAARRVNQRHLAEALEDLHEFIVSN